MAVFYLKRILVHLFIKRKIVNMNVSNTFSRAKFLTAAVFLATQLFFCRSSYAQQWNDSIEFSAKPEVQTWTVPKGVTQVHIDAYGAQGGGPKTDSTKGGKGGRVQSDLKVTPGEKLVIRVGSQPKDSAAGYNGGGQGCGRGYGGGGATDIRVGEEGLGARILVAGGGGGFGYGGFGGAGGGLTGGSGTYDTISYHIARGGTQDTGGAAAHAYGSYPGKLGTGGLGRGIRDVCYNGAMAGGGGGYYGGGAGGGGGGGGGSSYTNSSNTDVINTQGVKVGSGRLVIYWKKPER
jgi:hypothetical protein